MDGDVDFRVTGSDQRSVRPRDPTSCQSQFDSLPYPWPSGRSMCARIRSSVVVLVALGTILVASATTASAAPRELSDPPWLRIDRVEAEPSIFEGYARLRLHVTAVNLQGVIIDIAGSRTWALTLGSQKQRVPYIAGTFRNVDEEIALAIVVATTADFEPFLPAIQEGLTELIEGLPRDTRIAVIPYDDALHGSRRVGSKSRAMKELSRLRATVGPGEPVLIKAMDRARKALARAKPSQPDKTLRRIIIVVSDGNDINPQPANYRKVSQKADRDDIRIHTIAFPPDRDRRPLLGLAEMSKQSFGTFRFVRTKDSFPAHFAQLRKELQLQYVLTFFVPEDQLIGKKVGLRVDDKGLASTDGIRITALQCGETACAAGQYCIDGTCVSRNTDGGRGILAWVLLILGILVGVIVAFILLSLILGAVQRRRNAGASAPGDGQWPMPGMPPQPGGMPGTADGLDPVAADSPGDSSAGPQGGQIQPIASPYAARGAPARSASSAHQAVHPGAASAPNPSAQHRVVAPTGAYGAQSAAVQPSLLVLKGPYQGQRIPVHHGFTIGSAPGCHLTLTGDGFVSGHHAQILVAANGLCMLVDQGSTNGTFVNGVRATQKHLSHGMLIKIGTTEARFMAQ